MAFIYWKEDSKPKEDKYAVINTNDNNTMKFYTAEELKVFQESGFVIDGLPKKLRLVQKNKNLHTAKKEKNDEFYTQLSDIEKELMNYDKELFKDKVIYCPTDVAYAQGRILPSEFVHYFQLNAKRLGFKRLVATCLADKVDNQDVIYNRYEFYRYLRPQCDPSKPSYNPAQQKYYSEDLPDEVEYYDGISGDKLSDANGFKIDTLRDALNKQMELNEEEYKYEQIKMKRMNESDHTYESKYVIRVTLSQCEADECGGYGSGDFRSKECTEILKNSDIVVTNPPFSIFREFMLWFLPYIAEKNILVIGSQNAITYKEIFPLIRDNKLWLGSPNKCTSFYFIDAINKSISKFRNVCWYTNLKHNKYYEDLFLYESYYEKDGVTPLRDSDSKYPKYDNYDAINIDKVKEIPRDYFGVMGVPITFLYVYNPNQFEIVGCSYDYGRPNGWSEDIDMSVSIDGKNIYKRILIQRQLQE